jgi:hypothetical protein
MRLIFTMSHGVMRSDIFIARNIAMRVAQRRNAFDMLYGVLRNLEPQCGIIEPTLTHQLTHGSTAFPDHDFRLPLKV